MLYHDLALAIVGLYEQLAAFEIAQRNRVAHALGVVPPNNCTSSAWTRCASRNRQTQTFKRHGHLHDHADIHIFRLDARAPGYRHDFVRPQCIETDPSDSTRWASNSLEAAQSLAHFHFDVSQPQCLRSAYGRLELLYHMTKPHRTLVVDCKDAKTMIWFCFIMVPCG